MTAAIAPEERLIVALDLPSCDEARRIVDDLGDAVGFYKIGLQLLFAGGFRFAQELIEERSKKVFIDAKLYDISNQVSGAVANIATLGATFLTVHANPTTVKGAVEGRGKSRLQLLAVTVLTSLDRADIKAMGYEGTVQELVLRRAATAREAGCDGVIASGEEAALIKKHHDDLMVITPGIRSAGAASHDQKRIVTPAMAIAAGADYLVIGRQILNAPARKAEALRVLEEMAAA